MKLFAKIPQPAPPVLDDDPKKAIRQLQQHIRDLAIYNESLQMAIATIPANSYLYDKDGVLKGQVSYNAPGDFILVQALNDATLRLVAGAGIRTSSNFSPVSNNAASLGTVSLKWANVHATLINGADYGFENGWRITEPNNVWEEADPQDGLVFLDELWTPVLWIKKNGNILARQGLKKANKGKRVSSETQDGQEEKKK